MKNKLMKKMKRSLRKGRSKGMLLVEMADDFMDIIQNAKLYKKMNRGRRKLR
ncbi:hypothetical protein ACQPUY_00335 [Clostridium nigeriense]|uniref:hypothetical protein n=1 Tax=Clostridium nigeriense TaxID=1805470 RepID=UPI003D34A7A3